MYWPEFQQMLGSKFFSWDEDLQCEETGEPALVNTSDISEELGQIQYLFMDKTGTLTQNQLQLQHLSIEGVRYIIRDDSTLWRVGDGVTTVDEQVDPMANEKIIKFLRVWFYRWYWVLLYLRSTYGLYYYALQVIALCHSVHLVPRREEPHVISAAFKQDVTKEMQEATSLEDMQFARIGKSPMSDYLRDMEYEATSMDEKALLEACCK